MPVKNADKLNTTQERNPGIEFDRHLIETIGINRSAVERRAATLNKRRSIKKDWQAAWLLRAVSCIDLTTLSGDDTPGNVRRLCAKARQPVREDLMNSMEVSSLKLTVGAVCVYHNLVRVARETLYLSRLP